MTEIMRGTGLVYGTDEAEVIWTFGSSIIFAGAGDDGVRAAYQNDVAYMGDGNDVAYLEAGNDLAFGEAGDDLLYGGSGNDWLDGGEGNDFLWGGEGSDQLFGREGDDTIYGVTGTNALYGSLGNDLIIGGDGTDVIFGGEDNDVILGNDGNDWISGGSGDNQISGGAGDDVIYGSGSREGRSNEFFYRGDDGNDTVNSFNAETDQFVIAANINDTGIESISDFSSRVEGYANEEDSGDFGTMVDLGGGNSIQLVGVAADDVIANLADFFTVAA